MDGIYTDEMMGIEYTYVVSESGSPIYKQKRNLSINAWTKLLCKSLLSHGFSWDYIESRWSEIFNKNNYFNKEFYRPISSIVQERIDLNL